MCSGYVPITEVILVTIGFCKKNPAWTIWQKKKKVAAVYRRDNDNIESLSLFVTHYISYKRFFCVSFSVLVLLPTQNSCYVFPPAHLNWCLFFLRWKLFSFETCAENSKEFHKFEFLQKKERVAEIGTSITKSQKIYFAISLLCVLSFV